MTARVNSDRFVGRRILITGGASGIGLACARSFIAGGAHVAILDRNERELEKIASDLCSIVVAADVTDEDAVTRAVERAAHDLGGLDGLVNAAGIAGGQLLVNTTRQHWRNVLEVNLTGPMLVTRVAVAFLQRNTRGTIVNVASGIALRPFAGQGAYAASKAGLLAWTKVLSQELAPNIRVNATCPGATDTPLMRANVPTGMSMKDLESQYALQRHGTAAEQAEAIAFLTSDESSFITGVSLAVDGGRTFH